jgi:hypothetical protein
MSDAAVYIRWGTPIVGRESKSVEVFKEGLAYWSGLEKEGQIAGHREYFTTNGDREHFRGFALIEGTVAQLRSMLDSKECQSLLLKVTSVVTQVEIVHCVTGAEVPKLLEAAATVRKQLGIST